MKIIRNKIEWVLLLGWLGILLTIIFTLNWEALFKFLVMSVLGYFMGKYF